ncbi:hypothetical protein B4U79_00744 [Dinothrombium tinctorium]|uniref:Uncharacterized protein n=1 Tax=Dinothrombium tinctorium TaxID=1965070 RepID=A0A443QSI1_9ACAR|nr:hypothetical protein B4U79_00744 [Dinothrombium tinctorium]
MHAVVSAFRTRYPRLNIC